MPKPKTCPIRRTVPRGPTMVSRRTVPRGPMTLCGDLPCFSDCHKYTLEERKWMIKGHSLTDEGRDLCELSFLKNITESCEKEDIS